MTPIQAKLRKAKLAAILKHLQRWQTENGLGTQHLYAAKRSAGCMSILLICSHTEIHTTVRKDAGTENNWRIKMTNSLRRYKYVNGVLEEQTSFGIVSIDHGKQVAGDDDADVFLIQFDGEEHINDSGDWFKSDRTEGIWAHIPYSHAI